MFVTWQGGIKVANGIKVAKEVTLKQEKLYWVIWVGSVASQGSFKCGKGGQKSQSQGEKFKMLC